MHRILVVVSLVHILFTAVTSHEALISLVPSWISEIKQTADGHCSELGWRTSPREEVRSLWLLLR